MMHSNKSSMMFAVTEIIILSKYTKTSYSQWKIELPARDLPVMHILLSGLGLF